MANKFNFKLKPMSIRLTFIAFAVFLLFAALSSFGIVNLTNTFDLILGTTAALVIFIEVGLAQIYKTKGKSLDALGLIGVIAGIITLTTIILEFASIGSGSGILTALNGIQGLVFGVLVVSFFVETFK